MSIGILDQFEKDDYDNSRPHPIGRPPKLTTEMIEQFCDLLIQGQAIAKAAILTGISESTIYRWLAVGKKEGAEVIYAELVERVSEAIECSEFELLQRMRKAGEKPDHWRATAWMLERRFPEKYGKKSSTQPDFKNIKSESNSGGLVAVV
jgi:transposase